MSVWKDTMSPNWRTDALKEELRQANEKIRRLELRQQTLERQLQQACWKLAKLSGEDLS